MYPVRKEKQDKRRNEEKWTPILMEAGFTVIPSIFLERQRALALDPIDINIIFHLAMYWWQKDNPPYPSKRTLAECMNISTSTVQRKIARMEKDGLIERRSRFDAIKGQKSNEYVLDGLIKSATPFAQEKINDRKQKQEEASARRKRKRPRFSVIESTEDE